MIEQEELTRFLETYLDPSAISDYCPNGLQVEGKKVVERAATAVSANLETIEEAICQNIDALIVHHGLFWKGDAQRVEGTMKKKLKLLLDNEISLFGYHLPLDAHKEVGNNWCAAAEMGWSELCPFGARGESAIGVKGTFPELEIDAFIAKVEAYYNHVATVSKGGCKRVRSAALISGGAWRDLKTAAKAGVDCFITGNFDEPAWSIAKEEKIHFLALGHSATERIGPKALGKFLEEHFKIPCPFIDIENPF
ncbi:MAG: GTP cyclohydrolase 1 type 2 [Chlamydiales bacterium]|nr:GTP cyclohydrolase 1 type 2 [Chlamydiales bacterium]MCH9620352.1 GTP cyclohydrolase 1 type 2 [Chlamydiales bacterium]MCH9622338.1 GTP cyclohydrolase 1 type 2 [Chlamydiales bacterium]